MSTLTPGQFKKIATIARDRWGLDLTDRKQTLVANRLTKFLRSSPFEGVEEYLDHLECDATEEDMLAFFDLLSTNVTSFFRERAHFDFLEREFYTPRSRGNLTAPGRRIRIWSAACSTGPEPYSLAMHAIEHLPDLHEWDFKVLATDLATSALSEAKRAVYPSSMVDALPKDFVQRYFLRGKGSRSGFVKVMEHVCELVTICRLNLMERWPIKGPFDVIFCRNVMIYFDRPTREELVQRMYDLLHPGGVLAIGSAETLAGLNTNFRTAQPSVYLK